MVNRYLLSVMVFYELISGNNMLRIHVFIRSKGNGAWSNVKEYSIIAIDKSANSDVNSATFW